MGCVLATGLLTCSLAEGCEHGGEGAGLEVDRAINLAHLTHILEELEQHLLALVLELQLTPLKLHHDFHLVALQPGATTGEQQRSDGCGLLRGSECVANCSTEPHLSPRPPHDSTSCRVAKKPTTWLGLGLHNFTELQAEYQCTHACPITAAAAHVTCSACSTRW